VELERHKGLAKRKLLRAAGRRFVNEEEGESKRRGTLLSNVNKQDATSSLPREKTPEEEAGRGKGLSQRSPVRRKKWKSEAKEVCDLVIEGITTTFRRGHNHLDFASRERRGRGLG